MAKNYTRQQHKSIRIKATKYIYIYISSKNSDDSRREKQTWRNPKFKTLIRNRQRNQ